MFNKIENLNSNKEIGMKSQRNYSIEQLLKNTDKEHRHWQQEMLTELYFEKLHQDILMKIDHIEENQSQQKMNSKKEASLKIAISKD